MIIGNSAPVISAESPTSTLGENILLDYRNSDDFANDVMYSDQALMKSSRSLVKTDLSVREYLESENQSRIFTNALKQTSAWHRLQSDMITLFVVSDAALEREGSAFLLEQVLIKKENTRRLNDLIELHIAIAERVHDVILTQSEKIKTSNDKCIRIDAFGSSIKVGPEAFITKTISTKNGEIHYLDRLLWQKYSGNMDCTFV